MNKSAFRLAVGLISCFVAWFSVISGQEPIAPGPNYVEGELLVRFKPGSSRANRDASARAKGARVLRRLSAVHVDRVQLPAGVQVQDAIAEWRSDANVLSVEPNYVRRITAVPDDPYWVSGSLWGMAKIQADRAWLLTTGSPDVIVANLDTGVNYAHPDLAANMWRNPGEIAGNGLDDDDNGYVDDVFGIDTANDDTDPMDDHGHGTHTAGTIGAIGGNGAGVVGVNWNVRILPCKFLRADGGGLDSGAIECFNYIVALKSKGVNIRVTSNSWGGARSTTAPFPTSMKAAIDAAGDAGILNVFAAGNSGLNNDIKPFDPASFTSPSIVSVAASGSLDTRASFSNYGATSVDLAAPGTSILSTTRGGGYGSMSGTSMATPHVAGAAALMSALKPALTVAGVKSLLMSSVDVLPAWNGIVASSGRLNVYLAALDGAGDIAPTVSMTLPAGGSTFIAPATTTVAATASDADGTVSKVDFYANGSLIGTDTTSPYSVSWTFVTAGAYNLSAVATDDRMFTATSAIVAVTVSAITGTTRVNVAQASNGGRVTASTTYSSNYAASFAIDGNRRANAYGNTWADKTSNVYPDWLQVDFAAAKIIDEIDVFSGQSNASVDPTITMTSSIAIADFQVQYWTGSAWSAVPGGSVTGNNRVWRQFNFAPLTTTGVRVLITRSGNALSRVAELEAYESSAAPPPPPPPPPGGRLNFALAANGGRVTVSSTYSSTYAMSFATDGNRRASPYANTWADKTSNAYPDWLQVDFAGERGIDEVNIFTGQGNGSIDPTATMTSSYALADFQVQYWNGSAWAAVPSGVITGNNLVWRRLSFSPVDTTAIRVLITRSGSALSRIAEVEALGPVGTTAPPSALIGFPDDNWWNLDISAAPVDANSANFISFINNGAVRRLHPDFGGHASPGSIPIYGMPYVIVDSTVPKKAVQFVYHRESDGVDHTTNVSFPFYPIPDSAITEPYMIEGGYPGNIDRRGIQDRHLLIVDRDARHLYELYNVFHDGTKWLATSGAFFDMNTNDRRPDGWTSADAGGLAILPGLVRYDEAFGTEEIRHAFRVTVRATNGYVFPASHRAGSNPAALPFGARLRLKASKDLSGFRPELQRIFRAMQRYGLIVADNGTDMFISGAFDPRWSNDILNPAFRSLNASDFDVISLGYE